MQLCNATRSRRLARIMFVPGFSTAEKVNDLSRSRYRFRCRSRPVLAECLAGSRDPMSARLTKVVEPPLSCSSHSISHRHPRVVNPTDSSTRCALRSYQSGIITLRQIGFLIPIVIRPRYIQLSPAGAAAAPLETNPNLLCRSLPKAPLPDRR
jgi:hypothetical protein